MLGFSKSYYILYFDLSSKMLYDPQNKDRQNLNLYF
jgi:hypothetical protein